MAQVEIKDFAKVQVEEYIVVEDLNKTQVEETNASNQIEEINTANQIEETNTANQIEETNFTYQVEKDLSKNLSDTARHGFIKKVYSILSVQ